MRLPRHCSASGMFAEARTDCFHTTMRKRCASLVRRVRGSSNTVLAMIADRLDCRVEVNVCAYADGMRSREKKGVRERLADELYTCAAFWIAVSTLPALAFSYIVVRVSKHLWLKLLSNRYPNLEFVKTDTIRSLLDTHRNRGIINVLLSIKGAPDTDQIKNQLINHVTDRRDKNGGFMFPRLRQHLVSRWGNYAWDKNVQFSVDNHVIVTNSVYRGRPVTDSTIQDYVSEIVSKYFPSDQSPWQYIIIPVVSLEPKYYVLVRVHHMLLSGKNSINIGDLLMVQQLNSDSITSYTEYTQQSPLAKLFPTPSAIPELWGKINENLSNAWNEFISEYDPMESPRALKTLPGAFHVAGLVLIAGACALRELTKKRSNNTRYESHITPATFFATVQQECKRRKLTIIKILISPLVTADPRKWPRRTFKTVFTTTRTAIKLPMQIIDEIKAIKQLKNTGRVMYPNTFTWKYGELGQLLVRALGEAWRGFVEAYRAPAKLWSHAVRVHNGRRHLLQTVNLCGRKVAVWSQPVPRADIERTAQALGISSSDITLYAATEAMRSFFEQSGCEVPQNILTTARAASEDFLFTFAEGQGKDYKKSMIGGMICLSLPVGASPSRIASVVEDACKRQSVLAGAWAAQARYGALTRAVPSPIARLTLNLLSRRYAVSYAEINTPINAKKRTTLWGQTVDCVVYWRPPQANISMSLTVIQYADTVVLAVMTDSRLSPSHTVPAVRFPKAIEHLVKIVDQMMARRRDASNPQIITPDETIDEEDMQQTSSSGHIHQRTIDTSHMLRPPSITAVSPPPLRKHKSHN